MNKTIGLTIDGRKIYAEQGTTILEAARQNGISIPTLCYHPRLEPLGHCRLCIVSVRGMERPVTSCDNPVTEGMEVTTASEELTAMRCGILELMLATHPYKDCLTCVRTGTCELQEGAYRLQSDLPGQIEREVPAEIDASNPHVVRDEEKCILCGRCLQVCRTGAGSFVYEMIGNGVNTRVVPYKEGREVSMEEAGCIFCGQCVDVCPVAALTEQGRSRGGREWELSLAGGVCVECSLGCYLERRVSDGDLIKISVPVEGDKVSWLCKKGKFGFTEQPVAVSPASAYMLRQKSGKLAGTDRETALKEAAAALLDIKEKHGPEALAVLSSGKLSIEENYLLQKLAREVLNTSNIDLGAEPAWAETFKGVREAVGAGPLGPTPYELSRAEGIVVIGSGLEDSHPVADMAIGRAGRYGDAVIARIASGDGAPSAWKELNLEIEDEKAPLVVGALLEILKGAGSEKVASETGLDRTKLKAAARLISRPGTYLVVGPSYFAAATGETAAELLELARVSGLVEKGRSRVLLLSSFSNAAGVIASGGTFAAGPGLTTPAENTGPGRGEILSAVKSGKIKGFLAFGDPGNEYGPLKPGFLALAAPAGTVGKEADLLLPAQGIESKEGLFINAAGLTRFNRAALERDNSGSLDWLMIRDLAVHMGAKWVYASLEEVREEMEG